jgi:hypothetical protein
MPFFDDTGVKTEEHSGPVFGAFARLFDQLERMVVLNLAWSLTLIPAMIGLSVVALPLWARVLLGILSLVLVIPATAMLFELIGQASQGELISLEAAREALVQKLQPSFRVLLPLYSTFFWLGLFSYLAGQAGIVLLDALARLGVLLALLVSVYWGPVFAFKPEHSFLGVLRESIRLALKRPLQTLMTAAAVLLVWVIGVVSIGGMFLAAQVLSALMQTQLYFQTIRSR